MATMRSSRRASRARSRSRAGGRSRGINLTISEKRAIAGRKGALARWGRRRRNRR